MKEVTNLVPTHLMADAKDDARKAKNTMGKDDFMKLLMTQLRHQDPMKPMDHHEFGAQLAQFTQMEQLTNIGTGIKGLRTDRQEDSKLQAISMIGKKVNAAGNEVTLMEGQSVLLRPNVKEGVQPAKAMIYDQGNQLVREINLTGKTIGDGIQWDGLGEEGQALASGKYSFRVYGVDKMGQAQEIATEMTGRVTGMELKGKEPVLIVQTASGTSRLEMSRVTGISVDDDTKAAAVPGAAPALTPKPQIVAQVDLGEQPEVSAPTMDAGESEPTMFGERSRPEMGLPTEGFRR